MTKHPVLSTTFLDSPQRPAFALALLWALMMIAMHPAQAQTFTVLHNFTGGADGYYPDVGLILHGAGNLYGGAGPNAVFRLSQRGSGWVLNPIFEFNGTSEGDFLNGRLTVGPDGALYGPTGAGGIPDCADGAGCGLIFSMRPPGAVCRTVSCAWTETVLYSFNPFGVPDDGYVPTGALVFDAAGNLYGTTNEGGQYGQGTIYQLVPSQGSWIENILYSFHGLTDGGSPVGSLVIDHAGDLYGTTFAGGDPHCFGTNSCGVVFELSPTSSGWVETVLHTFQDGSDGMYPGGGLIADHSGNLYGATAFGGSNGGGTVYELTSSNGGWTFNTLYALTGSVSYDGPVGILAMDSSGNLYGATNEEGAHNDGNIFKLTLAGGNWTYTDLHDFAGGSGDGASPNDGPTVDADGNLYGTALEGGTGSGCPYGCGVVWEILP